MRSSATPHPGRRCRLLAALALTGLAVTLGGCQGDAATPTDALRFGQAGQVRVEVQTPVLSDSTFDGSLRQTITWRSSGGWRLEESLSYQGRLGDGSDRASVGDVTNSALSYYSWIVAVNDNGPAQLVGYDPSLLIPGLDPRCQVYESRVTLTVYDEARTDSARWTRCAQGSLAQLDPVTARGDAAASRVIQAAILLRDWTVGEDFRSVYAGSLPFATLERGEDLRAEVPGGGVIRDQGTWQGFWADLHGDSAAAPPPVDFAKQVVLIGVGKPWGEAGDSIEVRRVLPVQLGTKVELVERRPGDFCSPATQPLHRPYHVVLSPDVQAPVQFNQVNLERVPCQ